MDSELQLALRDPEVHPERILTLLERSGYDTVNLDSRSKLGDVKKILAMNLASAHVGDVVKHTDGWLYVVGASQKKSGRVLVRTGTVTKCGSYPTIVLLNGKPLSLKLPESWRAAALLSRYQLALEGHIKRSGCTNYTCKYRIDLELQIEKFGEAIPC